MPPSTYGPTMPNAELFATSLDTPIGTAQLVYDDAGRVHAFGWYDGDNWLKRFGAVERAPPEDPFGLTAALRRYFEGAVQAIDDIPVHFGGSPFQNEVWRALRTIPAGETLSYGAQAARIGKPSAARAVGLANGANPIGVIVPCHRVIGADGKLTGYGGGIDRKKWLLAHEARHTGLFGSLR